MVEPGKADEQGILTNAFGAADDPDPHGGEEKISPEALIPALGTRDRLNAAGKVFGRPRARQALALRPAGRQPARLRSTCLHGILAGNKLPGAGGPRPLARCRAKLRCRLATRS